MAFDSVYLEIVSPHWPSSPRREYRSLFKGRSAKVLRVLLSSPDRTWRLAELAQESRISIGHVSNVQSSLLDREWANRNEQGLLLTSPRALLDAWSAAYERPLAAERRFYTTLHGSMLEEALRDFFISTKENYPGGATSLAEDCRKLLEHESARTGYGFIDAKFGTVESYGPTSVRLFVEESAALGDQTPEQWQQDAYGQVNEWLIALGLRTPQ